MNLVFGVGYIHAKSFEVQGLNISIQANMQQFALVEASIK